MKDLYFDITTSIDDGTSEDVIIRRLIEYYVMEYRVAKDIFTSVKARHMLEVAFNE
jgi:hypothetical protein